MFEQVMLRNVGVPDGHTITIYESTGGYRALAKALRDYRPEQIIELVKNPTCAAAAAPASRPA